MAAQLELTASKRRALGRHAPAVDLSKKIDTLLDEFDYANRCKALEARRNAQKRCVKAIEWRNTGPSTDQRVHEADVRKGKRADRRSTIRGRDAAQLAIVQWTFVWRDIACTIWRQPPDRSVCARVLYRLLEQRSSTRSEDTKNLQRRDFEIQVMQDCISEHQIDRPVGHGQAVC